MVPATGLEPTNLSPISDVRWGCLCYQVSYPAALILFLMKLFQSHCIDGGVKTNSCKMRRRVTTSLISFSPWTAIVKVLVSVVIMICDSNYCCNISGKKRSRAVRCGRLLRDADKTAPSTMGKNNSIKFGKYVCHQYVRFVIQYTTYFLNRRFF